MKVGRSAVDEGLRDQVRDRCARAALAVTEPGGHSGLLLRRGLRTDGVGEAGEAFGAALYEPDQTSGLPQEAVLAAWSAAPRSRWPSCGRVVRNLGSGGGMT